MAWISLILAGLLEALGVAIMNQWSISRYWRYLILLFGTFAISLLLLHYSMVFISMGTAYAIWTGIGVIGGTVIGMLWYGESRNWKRILFIFLILVATTGLKIVE